MKKLLNFLNPTQQQKVRNPQFIHKTGVYLICDIYEHCSIDHLSKLLHTLLPLLFQIITNDQDIAVQQACYYCLGLMVSKCKNNVNLNYIQQILNLCQQCIQRNSHPYLSSDIEIFDEQSVINGNSNSNNDPEQKLKKRQFLAVIDNAMATICKVDSEWLKNNNNQQIQKIRNDALTIWIKHLPLKTDTVEAQICHQYLFKLIEAKNPIILGQNLSNIPSILKIFAKIRGTQLSTNQLDDVVKDFANTLCKQQPQFAQTLSVIERNNLGL